MTTRPGIPLHADFNRAPGLLEGATTYELSPEECDIEFWLTAVAQGTLHGLVRGRRPDAAVPDFLRAPGPLRDNLITEFAFRSLTEVEATRICALATAAAPNPAYMDFYATQTLDEARHADSFRSHLMDLGVPAGELHDTVERVARQDVLRLIDPMWQWGLTVLERNAATRFIDIVSVITVLLEGVLAPTTELSELKWKGISPATADIERGACVDEIRHLSVGSWIIRKHVHDNPSDTQRLVEFVAEGRQIWATLPTAEIIFAREQQYQEGILLNRDKIGDYEIFPGRRLVDTTPEERLLRALQWSEDIQRGRLAYMGLSDAMPAQATL
jgi:hypothetical protein